METREPRRETLDEIGHGRRHVLAVVEHQQDISFSEPVAERILEGLTPRPRQSDLGGHLAADVVSRLQRREPDHEHAVGELRLGLRRDRERDRRLPTPPGPVTVVKGVDATLFVSSAISRSLPTSERGCKPGDRGTSRGPRRRPWPTSSISSLGPAPTRSGSQARRGSARSPMEAVGHELATTRTPRSRVLEMRSERS